MLSRMHCEYSGTVRASHGSGPILRRTQYHDCRGAASSKGALDISQRAVRADHRPAVMFAPWFARPARSFSAEITQRVIQRCQTRCASRRGIGCIFAVSVRAGKLVSQIDTERDRVWTEAIRRALQLGLPCLTDRLRDIHNGGVLSTVRSGLNSVVSPFRLSFDACQSAADSSAHPSQLLPLSYRRRLAPDRSAARGSRDSFAYRRGPSWSGYAEWPLSELTVY